MIVTLLLVLIVLWAIGFLPAGGINIPNITFFVINGREITLLDLLALGVVSWIVGLLPSPFRLIASILLILLVLSILGIGFFTGLSQWLMLTIIVGLVFYVIQAFIPHRSTE